MPHNGPAIWGGCVPAIGGVAQFLQIPAKDKFVSVAGFVQSRSHEFGR